MKYIFLLIIWMSNLLMASNMVNILKNTEKHIYRVVIPLANGTQTGTGFVINKDGYVITNHHVVDGMQNKLFLKNKWKKYDSVEIIKTFPKKDIAILKIKDYKSNSFLKLQDPKSIIRGVEAYSAGFPGGADLMVNQLSYNSTPQEGQIQGIEVAHNQNFPSNYKLIKTNVPLNSGDSGGPLLSRNGTVFGINTIKNNAATRLIANNEVVEAIAWAIHIEELIKLLKENNISYTVDSSDLSQVDQTQIIWIAFGVLALVVLLLFFVLSRRKEQPQGIDADEVSRLVRDKMKKHGQDSSGEVYEEYADEPYYYEESKDTVVMDQPRESTQLMRIALTPTDATLPTITSASDEPITVGRSQSCDVVLSHAHVSKEHLYLILQKDRVRVIDLGSTNGSYIEGQKLKPHKKYALKAGQKLIIGSEDIIYGY